MIIFNRLLRNNKYCLHCRKCLKRSNENSYSSEPSEKPLCAKPMIVVQSFKDFIDVVDENARTDVKECIYIQNCHI